MLLQLYDVYITSLCFKESKLITNSQFITELILNILPFFPLYVHHVN